MNKDSRLISQLLVVIAIILGLGLGCDKKLDAGPQVVSASTTAPTPAVASAPEPPAQTSQASSAPPPAKPAANKSRAAADSSTPASAPAQDTPDTVFKPPKGSQVAIVVFEDLQCPMCRRTAPLVEQAAKTYKIPVIRHDFPLPMHNWSYDAAIMARYFDTHSKAMGNDFRDYIFQNQLEINPKNLRDWAEKFATDHKIDFPFVIDPGGKFAAQVNADRDLGNAIKVNHTPTVYIVSSRDPSRPYVEVKDNSQLYATIDAVMKE